MVPERGLEPPRLEDTGPKPVDYTKFVYPGIYKYCLKEVEEYNSTSSFSNFALLF